VSAAAGVLGAGGRAAFRHHGARAGSAGGADTLARRVDESLGERTMLTVGGATGLAHVEDPALLDVIARAQGALVG